MMQAILSPHTSPNFHRETIDDGFIATLVDGGPALIGIILACTQLAVITWGIYGDILSAFLLAENTRFVALAAMATVIVTTASYMLGRLAEAEDAAVETLSRSRETNDNAASLAEDLTWPAESDRLEQGPTTKRDDQGPALRTRFFSEVANELRTPITSICLAARIIRKHHASTPEVVERFGETLVNDATRLGELINEFLELVRLESGCMTWKDEDVPVLELMQTAESYLAELAQLQQRRISVHVDGDLPPLNCDRERIVQVLTVLLSTTFSNTTESDAIGLYAFQHDGHTIFSITPEGGDPRAFRRAGRPKLSLHQGGGDDAVTFAIPTLTFNICQEIIAHYGGHISAEHRGNNTNVFRVVLPQSRSQQNSNPEPLNDAAAQAAEALTPARPMVLAEEDTEETAPPASPEAQDQSISCSETDRQPSIETLSEEQAAELLSFPAGYADDNDIDAAASSRNEDEPSSDDADSAPKDNNAEVLITPPPAAKLETPTAIPLLSAPRAIPSELNAGLPVLHASICTPAVSPKAGPPVAVEPRSNSVATTPGFGGRRSARIDAPIAGVRPDEDWHAQANNHPSHRSPAPWLAERLRQAAGTGLTPDYKPERDDNAPAQESPAAGEPRVEPKPLSQLHPQGSQTLAAKTRVQASATSLQLHRRKLGG